MNVEHTQQCKHIDEHIDEKVNSLTKNLQEFIIQRMSAYDSDLLNAIQQLDKKVEKHHEEMKPWLEAKIGLNLIWRWIVIVPIFVAIMVALKEVISWFGFHR